MAAVGPPPQTLEPRLALLMVGIWTTGPRPQSQPSVGFFGDRNAEKTVGPVPTGTLGSGERSGFQITGRMVRVMTFQSALTWIVTAMKMNCTCAGHVGWALGSRVTL